MRLSRRAVATGGCIAHVVEDAGDAAAARAKASWADESCPPDPQLDALFVEFARRRRGTATVPFVEQRLVLEEHRVRSGLFSSRIEKKTFYEDQEVACGWPIPTIGHRYSFSADTQVWYGLAIDIDGRPWLAQHADVQDDYRRRAYTDQMLRVNGHRGYWSDSKEPLLGRPTTRTCTAVEGFKVDASGRRTTYRSDNDDLRSVIMSVCLTHGGGTSREGLPGTIANAMGIPLPRVE